MEMATCFIQHAPNMLGKYYLIYDNINRIAIEYSTINQYIIRKCLGYEEKSVVVVVYGKDEENRWIGHRVTILFSHSAQGGESTITQIDTFQSVESKRSCIVRCGIANNGILFGKYQILPESEYKIDTRTPNILTNVGSKNMNLTPSNINSIDSVACGIASDAGKTEEKISNALCGEEQEKKESTNKFTTFNNENNDGESIGKGGNFGWGVITDEKEISELAAAVKHRGMVKKVLDGDVDSSLVFARFRFQRHVIEADRFFEDKLCQMQGLSEGIIEPVGYVLSPHNQLIAVFMIANYGNKPNEIYEKQKEMVITRLKARFGNNNNHNSVNDKIWFDSYEFECKQIDNFQCDKKKQILKLKFVENDEIKDGLLCEKYKIHPESDYKIEIECMPMADNQKVSKKILVKNLNDKYHGSIWFRDYPPNLFENENSETGANDNDENIKKLSNKNLITYWESEEANDLKKDYFDKMKQFLRPILTCVQKNRHNINSGLLARLKENSVEIQMLDEILHLSDNKYLYIFDLLVNQGFENFEHKFWSVKSKFFNDNTYFKDNNLLGMNWDVEYYVYCNLLNQQWCQNETAAIALQNEIDIFKDRMSVEQSRCNVVNLAKIIICCHLIMELINGGESDINKMVESCKKWFTK